MYRRNGIMAWGLGLLISTGSMLADPAPARGQSPSTDVLIVGDSIMQAVSRSLERQLGRRTGFNAASYTHIGSGLARLDLFDWHEQIQTLMGQRRPGLVLVMMGANDNQPMRTNQGQQVQVGSREWEEEYARRAGKAMDIMLSGGARQIHWLELPDMRDSQLQRDVTTINRLVQTEADKRTQVTFQTTRSLLSRSAGQYSPYIIQSNGMPLDIRARDGVHLNRQGADFLAERIIDRIWGS